MRPQVPGIGPKKCKICIIGEAPGDHEARVGKPFVGRSGVLLDELLGRVGIKRSECYITNVIKERPVDNDISKFISLSKKVPEVTADAQLYLDYLTQELKEVETNLFVPVGNVALWAVTGEKGISKRRGSIMRGLPPFDSQKVIPTLHPASALRVPKNTHIISLDLLRIAQEAQTPDIVLPERNLVTRPSMSDCLSYMQRLLDNKPEWLYFDIEIDMVSKHLISIAFSTSSDEAFCIPFTCESGEYFTTEDEAEVMLLLAKILEDPDIAKVAHNIMFDAWFMLRRYGIRPKNIHCSMLAHKLIAPDLLKGLHFLTSYLSREPYYKDESHEAFTGKLVDFKQFWEYNCKDVAVMADFWPRLLAELERLGLMELYQLYCRLFHALIYMQERGVLVNKQGMLDHGVPLDKEMDDLRAEMDKIAGRELPPTFPGSPKQQQQYFYEENSNKKYYKDGRVTLDAEALKKLEVGGDPMAKALRRYRKVKKLKGTYIDVDLDEDVRLRCSWNPSGTGTHRLSSSANLFGTGTNMQNFPEVMNQYLLADPGYMVFDFDLANADDRIVAFTGPVPAKRQCYLEGKDPHKLTAGLLFNMDPDDVSDEDGSSPLGSGEYSQRYWGKRCNHALNYGLGPMQFASQLEIMVSTAKMLRSKYHHVYPEVQSRYQHNIVQQLRKNRLVYDCFDRPARFLGFMNDDLYRRAYAYPPQSTVSWQINEHGILYIYENRDLFEPVEILLQVHDSVRFQIPVDIGWKSMANILTLIRNNMQTPIPVREPFVIPVDGKAGITMSKKAMKTLVFDDNLPQQLEQIYAEATEATSTSVQG